MYSVKKDMSYFNELDFVLKARSKKDLKFQSLYVTDKVIFCSNGQTLHIYTPEDGFLIEGIGVYKIITHIKSTITLNKIDSDYIIPYQNIVNLTKDHKHILELDLSYDSMSLSKNFFKFCQFNVLLNIDYFKINTEFHEMNVYISKETPEIKSVKFVSLDNQFTAITMPIIQKFN